MRVQNNLRMHVCMYLCMYVCWLGGLLLNIEIRYKNPFKIVPKSYKMGAKIDPKSMKSEPGGTKKEGL